MFKMTAEKKNFTPTPSASRKEVKTYGFQTFPQKVKGQKEREYPKILPNSNTGNRNARSKFQKDQAPENQMSIYYGTPPTDDSAKPEAEP